MRKLLYIDLCARIPYRPIVDWRGEKRRLIGYSDGLWILRRDILRGVIDVVRVPHNEDVKPYLRPMESMTDKERKELMNVSKILTPQFSARQGVIWLNAHHFDYRHLILNEMALEAPEDIYKPKNQ